MRHLSRSSLSLLLLALFAAFVFLQPIFSDMANWGFYDWDQHFFYHGAARVSLLEFGEFPLWTPYYCGGNLLLANPQSTFLSPFFVFVLAFGTVAGLKLEVLAYLALGLLGTYLVARKFNCSPPASAFAAVVFMFSSWYSARVVAGHTTFFPFSLLPFAFLFFLNAMHAGSPKSAARWVALSAAVHAVMFLSGGVYPFAFTLLFLLVYATLDFAGRRQDKLFPVTLMALVLVLSFSLAAVKVIPVFDFVSGTSFQQDSQFTSAGIAFHSLLSRNQDLAYNDLRTGRDSVPEGRGKELASLAGKLPYGWHEYSAYLGIVPLALAAFSFLAFRKNWRLILTALVFLWLSLGELVPGPWLVLKNVPLFSSLHLPSRFIIVFVFITALLAARSLSSFSLPRMHSSFRHFLVIILCVVVAADFLLVSRPLLEAVFPRTPPIIESTNLGSPQIIQMFSSAPSLSQYQYLLQGISTLNCYERVRLRTQATPQFIDGTPFGGFISNAYIAETNSTANFTHFSPHRLSLALPQIEDESTLVINQNYHPGWSVMVGEKHSPAQSYNGLLSARISPENSGNSISFSFSSRPFAIGALISLAAVLLSIALLLKPNSIAPVFSLIRKAESYVFRQS